MNTLGPKLKEIRNKRGLTLERLSLLSQVPVSQISQIENKKTILTFRQLRKLCKGLNVPYQCLVWLDLKEEEVPDHKVEAFKHIRPLVDDIIAAMVDLDIDAE